ncbi:MAG: carbamoyltransferase HypF [Bacteroidales bacterium]|nr:carbamoyltransferase HypF [Bacteroidales bacterium]
MKNKAVRFHISGRVQGVGFRPYIYNLARSIGLKGYVFNQPDGVIVHAEGETLKVSEFTGELQVKIPVAAIVKKIEIKEADVAGYKEFSIKSSGKKENVITEICPDISICDDCLKEMFSEDRRKGYPFINCTNCGPRFTLINDFPYDRVRTTMSEFKMCKECEKEYTDPVNRRFHAQPTSCYSCGPTYQMHYKDEIIDDIESVIDQIANNIDSGKIVAMKGLGGYNLACDASGIKAVDELRKIKLREKKPFAVMFRSTEAVRKIACMDPVEEQTLLSWRRPIVILALKDNSIIPSDVTSGLNTVGALLPYLPLHYLLFKKLKTDIIVLTSGNESSIPILFQEDAALHTFRNISGGIVINNRKIARRADDSVVRIIDSVPRIMRRARGYVPEPVDLDYNVNRILAVGGELSNCFCIGKDRQAILSQHIGDLQNIETLEFFEENIKEFSRIYRFTPKIIACDLHPDYLSTQYAKKQGLPLVEVQHHHAHIASVIAEYNIKGPVIGLTYDGTGLGTDGHIWGSEVMIADLNKFERISHFEYLPIPGGDHAVKEPWRIALSLLYKIYKVKWNELDIPFIHNIEKDKARLTVHAIEKKINCPLSCSAGRLFDAVAAILEVCNISYYHAEAPIKLENLVQTGIDNKYDFNGDKIIDFSVTVKQIVTDIARGEAVSDISTRFHNTVAYAALKQVSLASERSGLKNIALGGGSFQNKYLTEKIVFLLRQSGFNVFIPKQVPCNDGGLALGQLVIAANNNT